MSAAKTEYNTGEYWENADIFVFKNGAPYQMLVPDGRAIYSGGTWIYEFDYKDHLGNTRVSFRANGSNLERSAATDFDPWGVRLNGTGAVNSFQNRWELQGKEKEMTFNLNRVNFGARVYNAAIGRWDRSDPAAKAYLAFSNYVYAVNNPLSLVDPNGMWVVNPDGSLFSDNKEEMASLLGGLQAIEGGGEKGKENSNRVKFKDASHYDYSKEVIEGKGQEDWNYLINGDNGNVFSRAWQLFTRDWAMASPAAKTDVVLAAVPIARVGKLTAKGGQSC